MRRLKSLGGVLGAMLVVLLLVATARAEPTRITFLHFNDLDRMLPADGQGGVAELATLVRQARERSDHAIVTFGGDLISPSLMSGLDMGAHMIALMNALPLDVAVLGNHEFDFGPAVLRQRIAEAEFPWLATNVREAEGTVFQGAVGVWVKQVGDFTVGFFGITTEETQILSKPGPDTIFDLPEEAAAMAVESLRAGGADIVVALTHQEFDDDLFLLSEIPGLDVVLGGHDHLAISVYDGKGALMKAGSQGAFLAVLELAVERDAEHDKVRWRPEMRLLSNTGSKPDAEIAELVKGYTERLDRELSAAVGATSVSLDTTQLVVRRRETAFGNLLADAMRQAAGADVALINSGGIRGDRKYPAGTMLTRRDVLAELPFANHLAKLTVTGEMLHAALEHGLSLADEPAGRFPHVSGISLLYDPALPPGQRILGITVNGLPLNHASVYSLASVKYLADGGDGYDMLAGAELAPDPNKLLTEVLIDHLKSTGTVSPMVEGRIRVRTGGTD